MEGAVEVFLSYEVRNPSEVVHDKSFKATSADGPCGVYLPFPEEEAFGRKKRSQAPTNGSDEVEIYGTVAGLNPGMKNWYKLKVVEGWGLNSASFFIADKIVALLLTTAITWVVYAG